MTPTEVKEHDWRKASAVTSNVILQKGCSSSWAFAAAAALESANKISGGTLKRLAP